MHTGSGRPGIFGPHSHPSHSMCVDALPARKWHQEHLVPSLHDPAGQAQSVLTPPFLVGLFFFLFEFSLLLDDSCLFLCFPITLLGWTLASLASSCGFSASWLAGGHWPECQCPRGYCTLPGEVDSGHPCLPPGDTLPFPNIQPGLTLPARPRLPGGEGSSFSRLS